MAGVSTFVVGRGPTSFRGAALLPFAQSLEAVSLLWGAFSPVTGASCAALHKSLTVTGLASSAADEKD